MTLAEQAQKIEKDNTTLKIDLAKAQGVILTYKEEVTKHRKEIAKLQNQVDDHKNNPLQEKIKQLQAALKDANANKKVEKQKIRIQKLEGQLADEQSRRMKSENHPEVKLENEKLKADVEILKSSNTTHHKARTKADNKAAEATSDLDDATKLSKVYEDELQRLGVDTIQLCKSSGLKL